MATTKEKCLVKPDDRLKKTDFREKLRSMPALKKNETEKKRGPLIAKPTLLFTQTSSGAIQHTNDIPTNRGTRTPSPPRTSESAFTRQVVHNYRSFSPGPPSRRTRSPSYTRSSSPTSPSARRRTPSPTGFDAAFQEEIKKRVQKVLRARLYLLQQIGPNSFMIGGDSPMHKFRVIIGPQTCSCGHGPHCVHLLFVMLRVFQVSETDQRLWNRTLKNYEVESLFNNYHARRNVRMKNNSSYKDIKHSSAPASPTGSIGSKSELSNKDDEEICPICLLEMLDGESLVSCEAGCHNNFHHHCIAVWAEECQRQNEPIICPLCRAEWGKHKDLRHEANKQHSQSSSPRIQETPESILGENNVVLPHSDPIPREHLAVAMPWTQIFGEEVVACLFSRDWISRETALRYLSKEVTKSLATVSRSNSTCSMQENRAQDVLCHCCSILAYMAGDPVYKVFIASLKCLRTMLACVPCQNDQDLSRLQENLCPFVKTILLKCADGNRRTSQLSVSTLIELCRGQRGELAIGRETCCAWQDGIGGIGYLLNCIIENYNSNSVSWQWLLGRLCAIDKLMGEFPRDFCLLYIQGRQSNSSQVCVNDKDNLVNYERLVSLLNFSVGAINNQHTTVSKMARRVFVLVARRATHIPSVFSEFCDKLSILESSLQHRIRRRLRVIAQEFIDAASTPTSNKTEIYNSNSPWLHTKENQKFINNTLNSSEFFHDHVSKNYKQFKMNNLKSMHNDSLKSPSRPEHHFQRSLSVPTISSFHFQNIEKQGEMDLIDFSDPLEKHNSQSFFGKIEKPCPIKKESILKEEKLKPPKSLNVSLNFFDTSMIDDLSELSDLTMSFTCEDRLFTFKSEVTTPKSSPSRQPSKGLLHLCKEELEEEEAIALALAMDTSAQEALPHIPGLSSEDSNEVITIHLQPEMGENDCPHIYLENIHWVRGSLLGTGAFSSCYQVRDVKSGTIMAVKQVSFCRNSSDEQQRVTQAIKEEIVMMAKLNHPNVLRIMGATQQGGHFNMFVEWMPGGSVAGLLDKYGTFAESVIINYTQQVLRGLAYLHDNHILHRDLKGANLLVDSTGQRLRIADFGAAARLASHATGAGEFQGQLLGTIAFMAPEVLRGEDYGRNCDIWSVGCVMIEMATTKPPWNANDLSNHLALIFKIACSTGPPTIPEHLSPAARDLALRCLEQKPEDRPSAKELLKHPVFCISINGKIH